MPGDDAFERSVGGVDDGYVPHVELAHVVQAFGDVVCGLYHHWVLYEVRTEVDHCALVVVADLLVLLCHRLVVAPEVARELRPGEEFLVWSRRILSDIKVVGEVLVDVRLLRAVNPLIFKRFETKLVGSAQSRLLNGSILLHFLKLWVFLLVGSKRSIQRTVEMSLFEEHEQEITGNEADEVPARVQNRVGVMFLLNCFLHIDEFADV